ncbi:HNH endonuclease [Haloplanus natans]|uniref:HNH endonuclease n=1 Tax=Haloplanus natans TaxID=376171 RepID=UPI001FE1F9D9|nr:HNH endonuclease [Haloplanus natans]
MASSSDSADRPADIDLFIIPVSEEWLPKFDRTVRSPIVLDGPGIPDELVGREERIWGMLRGPRNTTTHEQMTPRDWLLFYNQQQFFATGRIGQCFHHDELGDNIWNNPRSELGFTVEDFSSVRIPLDDVRSALDYKSNYYPRGPSRVADENLSELLNQSGTISEFVEGYSGERPDSEEQVEDYEQPKRTETTTSRIIRNTDIVKELKETYDHECQVCGTSRQKRGGDGYAEGHHLKPLGEPHNGPDIKENILILCPNHHADFDYGRIAVNPHTNEITHAYEGSTDGATLTMASGDSIDEELLRYHNQEISEVNPPS